MALLLYFGRIEKKLPTYTYGCLRIQCKPSFLIAKVSYHPLMCSRCLDTVPAAAAVEAATAAVAVTAAVLGETPLLFLTPPLPPFRSETPEVT